MKNTKFKKVLGKKDVFVMAFGAMIGWGWVVMAGDWITTAGSLGACAAFLIGSILVLFMGLIYAELTSAMPKCGGEHVFSMKALGSKGSFICTWSIILGYVGVVAFEACALPTVIQYLVPNFLAGYMYTVAGFDVYASWVITGVLSSIVITIINCIGLLAAARFQKILTAIIAAVGIALIAGAVLSGDVSNAQPLVFDGFNGILSVAVMTPFMFVGFDVIPQAAEEINIPFKQVGRIVLFSIFLAAVWYIAIILAVSVLLPKAEYANSVLITADALKAAFFNSDAAAKVVIIGGVAGIVTSWNSFFVGGSRAIYAMAESNMLPKMLAQVRGKNKVPLNAVLLIGIISAAAPFFGRAMMVWLTNAGSLGVVAAYFLIAVSYLILRKKEPDMKRPYKVKYGWFVGIMGIFCSGFMLILYTPGMPSGLEKEEMLIVLFWMVLGMFFYQVSAVKIE